MKKSLFALFAAIGVSMVVLPGCGESEPAVVEAPAEDSENQDMDGISDEDYTAAMEEEGA